MTEKKERTTRRARDDGPGWFATLFKFGAIGSCYSVLLLMVTAAVALLSFILL